MITVLLTEIIEKTNSVDSEKKEDILISEWLISNEYAFAYDGGKKKEWNEFLENEILKTV